MEARLHPAWIAGAAAQSSLVLCVGMRRACSTWQFHVASELLGVRGFDAGTEEPPEPKQGSVIVVKTHIAHREYEPVLSGDARALYSYRDLRDVLYSWMFRVETDFEGGLAASREVLADDAFWRRQKNVLVQRYEEMVMAPGEAVGQIAHHLATPLSTEDAAALASRHSLEAMKRSKPGHVRTGKVGSWKDVATPSERRRMGEVMQPWLLANGYTKDDAWIREAP